MERLDRILSQAGFCSRKDALRYARKGLVKVNGVVVRRSDEKIDEDSRIEIDGVLLEPHRLMVCMMNKPQGFVTSTSDDRSRTVMELLPEGMLRQGIVPVGRLDKDTEGLLLFTNDGDLHHRLISPKHGVSKVYYVEHDGDVTDSDVQRALDGIVLKDGSLCRSAVITALGDGRSTIEIHEGMYHQVRRMYAALGHHVNFLRRIQVGPLALGDLPSGEVRELTAEEMKGLN
ncbi:MAG: rRNA pseudouridine synthase [Spirochaetales bacterium]|nr:rRNA pseudouridine synthase [Spirochaetales bacterium]